VSAQRLGRRPSRRPARRLSLAAFTRDGAAPASPDTCDWTGPVNGAWPMFANDAWGCCTISALCGTLLSDGVNAGRGRLEVPDPYIVGLYGAVLRDEDGTVLDAGNPATDRGLVALDLLEYVRIHTLNGRTLDGHGALREHDEAEIQATIHLFGSAYVGLNMPITAQGATSWDVPAGGWTPDNSPGSWGGHMVAVLGYDRPADTYLVISWGQPFPMSGGFLRACIDEAHVTSLGDWLAVTGRAPSGLDVAALRSELTALATG
jgi:hypothetical protein